MSTLKTDNVQSPSLSSPSVTVDPTTGIVTHPSGSSAGFATQAAANSTLILVAASATVQEFTGAVAGQVVQMPVTSTLLKGWNSIISNKSTQSITVNSSGGNPIATVPAGTDWVFICNAVTGTTAASWSNSYTGASAVPVSPTNANVLLTAPMEFTSIVAAAPSATQNIDAITSGDWFFTTNCANNFIINIRASASVTLNTLMAVGNSMTFAVRVINAATNYYMTSLTIDGGAITPKWAGGSAPTTGDASARDIYTFTVTKTAASTYEVLASVQKAA